MEYWSNAVRPRQGAMVECLGIIPNIHHYNFSPILPITPSLHNSNTPLLQHSNSSSIYWLISKHYLKKSDYSIKYTDS
jgi:hypothetical protein